MSVLPLIAVLIFFLGIVSLILAAPRIALQFGIVGVGLLILSAVGLSPGALLIAFLVVGLVGLAMLRTRGMRIAGIAVTLTAGTMIWLGFPNISDHGPSPGPPSAGGVECPDVLFVGLRGSGEERNEKGGYGDTVEGVRNALYARVTARDLTFADAPVDYLALAVHNGENWSLTKDFAYGTDEFMAGALVAADLLASKVRLVKSECGPSTRIVVVGYSQGAMVSQAGLSSLPSDVRSSVASVQHIASPVRAAGEVDWLSGEVREGSGILRAFWGIRFDPVAGAGSWCLERDVVCDFQWPPNASLTVHVEGYKEEAVAAAIADAIVRDLFNEAEGRA